jgi:hypothetical protein
MASPIQSQAQAREQHEAQEAIRKRAARQAAKVQREPETIPVVECLVLPMGDGKISMGEHVGGLGTAHYEEGEKFGLQLPIAVALYDRGYVNFEGAREASKDAAAQRAAQDRALRRAAEEAAQDAA